MGTINGDYYLFNTLGDQVIRVEATDADLDRGAEDQESSTKSNLVTIVDDDTTAPIINIQYIGSDNDGDPGYWSVLVTDTENEVDSQKTKLTALKYISTIS